MLKICDLGTAIDRSDAATAHTEITPYLVSRFYRAPEIILGMSYDYGVDMWSIGCTLYELYTGKILFTGDSNNQMLKAIMEIRGRLTPKLYKRGQLSAGHFDDLGQFVSVEHDKMLGKVRLILVLFLLIYFCHFASFWRCFRGGHMLLSLDNMVGFLFLNITCISQSLVGDHHSKRPRRCPCIQRPIPTRWRNLDIQSIEYECDGCIVDDIPSQVADLDVLFARRPHSRPAGSRSFETVDIFGLR